MCAAFGLIAETLEIHFERYLRYVRSYWLAWLPCLAPPCRLAGNPDSGQSPEAYNFLIKFLIKLLDLGASASRSRFGRPGWSGWAGLSEGFEMHFGRYLRCVRSFWPLCRDLRNAF